LTVKRWVKAWLITAGLLAILSSQPPRYAAALSCVPPKPIDVLYERSDGIVLAKVEKVTGAVNNDSRNVQVRVLQSYKGVTDSSLTLLENSSWGSYWGSSEKGQTYLFFLRKGDAGWENPLCSPTRREAEAVKELAFLKGKEIPLNGVPESSGPSGGRVWQLTGGALGLFGLLGYGAYRYTRRRR
jgi:MYXO-CTERM domain-containing protein